MYLCIMKFDIYINGYIGRQLAGLPGDAEFFSLQQLNAELAQLPKGTTELVIHINSGGGSVTEGFAIYDKLMASPYRVTTVIEGLCGSIATVIAMAGTKGRRLMHRNSEFFIHNPYWQPAAPTPMEADDLRTLSDELRRAEARILGFYCEVTRMPKNMVAQKMKAQSSLTAFEALQMGFIDEVITANVSAKKRYALLAFIEQNQIPSMNRIEEMFARLDNKISGIRKKLFHNTKGTTPDGVTLYWDGELAEGTPVFADEALTLPAEDGDYEIDGQLVTVEAGLVTVVAPAEQEVQQARAKAAQLQAKLADTQKQLQASTTRYNLLANDMNELAREFTNFKNKLVTGGKETFQTKQTFKGDTHTTRRATDRIADEVNRKLKG